ncbi:MAG: hypothetical protein OHK0053_34710 [Microscillaceae bacterium]
MRTKKGRFYGWVCLLWLGGASAYGQVASKVHSAEADPAHTEAELSQTQSAPVRIGRLVALGRFYANANPEKALQFARKAEKEAKTLASKSHLAEAQLTLGYIFLQQSVFSQALRYLLAARQQFGRLRNLEKEAAAYLLLGQVYQATAQSPEALKNYQKALTQFRKSKNEPGEAEALGHIGHIYEKQMQWETARQYQRSALRIYQKLKNPVGMAQIYENLGSIYEDWEKFDTARRYFEQALALNQAANQQIAQLSNLNNLADTYRKQGDFEKALVYTQKSLEKSRFLQQKYQERSALKDLAKTYAAMGNYQKAHDYLLQSYDLYQEIFNGESTRQMARLQTIYDLQEKEKEIALLGRDRQLSRLQNGALLIGLVLLLALSLLLYSRQRLKLHKNRESIAQNQRIYEAQHELTQAELQNAQLNELKLKTELENKQLREEKLQDELQAKNRELTAHALHLIQKNELLDALKQKIQHLRHTTPKTLPTELNNLLHLINYSFNQDKDWEHFKQMFEQVHQDFFDRLQTQYPELTAGEIRLCALIRLHLNSQDMATILGIGQDSLRVTRYRLRKKLHLPKGSNLTRFILQF